MSFDFYQRMHDEKEIYSERGVSVWQIYSYVSIRKDGRIKKDNDYTVWCVWKSVKSEMRSWNVEMKTGKKIRAIWCSLLLAFSLAACGSPDGSAAYSGDTADISEDSSSSVQTADTVEDVPEYSGEPYVEINDNQPEFEEYELTTVPFEEYSELDELGRCGEAEACVGEETMPTEERESISSVEPTGWENEKYDNVDGGYVYNRCHLIGFQLTGENANEENLITGTRYMNTEGMLPFENMIADYIHETDNHVLYRVTPVFEGEDLVASGVQMEAESVEDDGAGICFNVYVYNVQPQITINYATGENWESSESENGQSVQGSDSPSQENKSQSEEHTYIINENTDKFHAPDCSSVDDIKEKNKREITATRDELIEEGYEPCGICKP